MTRIKAFAAFAFALLLGAGIVTDAHAVTYYASRCDAGADPACVAGSDANAGTVSTAPITTCAAIVTKLNALGPGDSMLLARGASWTSCSLQWASAVGVATRAQNPAVLGAYTPAWGPGTAKPKVFAGTGAGAVAIFGNSGAATQEQGYMVRDLYLSGYIGVNVMGGVKWVTILNNTLDGTPSADGNYGINCAGYQSGRPGDGFTQYVTARGNTISGFRVQGVFTQCRDFTLDGNTISRNGTVGADHNLYIASPLDGGGLPLVNFRTVIRGNTFSDNNVGAPGSCVSVAIVAHGNLDQLLIEDNTLRETVVPGAASCWGMGLAPGWNGKNEYARRVTIRRNKVIGYPVGILNVSCDAGCVTESNVIVQPSYPYENYGLVLREYGNTIEAGDAVSNATTTRNNTVVYLAATTSNARGIILPKTGTNHVIAGNLVLMAGGASASAACFDTLSIPVTYSVFDNNLCFATGGTQPKWEAVAGTLASWRAANPGRDAASLTSDPQVTAPASPDWLPIIAAASPARGAGHATQSAATDVRGCSRAAIDSAPDIGAYEYSSGTCTRLAQSPTAPR